MKLGSWAVTVIGIVLVPTFSATGLLALPPFTVTVAPGWVVVGVRVSEVTLLATVAV